jgi:hypothetical protein|tara:strand:+ start:82 stop:561 length:480 start_codon:yes stop_codon:yes gene_type:complete
MGTFNVTGAGGTTGHPSNGRTPYLVENTIDIAQIDGDAGSAQDDILQALDIPAETLIMNAGIEVLTACSSSVTLDLGITGTTAGFSDTNAYVAAYDATGASYAPTLGVLPLIAKVAETLDVVAAGAASSAGKIRVWAIMCDISGVSETDTNTDAQHDTE